MSALDGEYYPCIHCGEAVTTGSLMRWGMTAWYHVIPWDFEDPTTCRPTHAGPNFNQKVRFERYAGGFNGGRWKISWDKWKEHRESLNR